MRHTFVIVWALLPHFRRDKLLIFRTYRSLNAIVAQPQNCPFGVNNIIELENITTSNNTGIQRGTFQLTSQPILLDAFVIVLSSIVVLTPKDNFWVVPLLHSAKAKTLQKNRVLLYLPTQETRTLQKFFNSQNKFGT